ncbi:hypothetical protein [Streptomyces sp.]|uniref:hypothetical protein n=1 Tax=Streptomyces sp. TaxID=1931 RepID=UPI002F426C37
MPGDNLFAANPSDVQRGGKVTDDVSTFIMATAKAFADATSYDPQDPPWGDDKIGHGFEANYLTPHSQLRDAVTGFAEAVAGAARLTITSGTNFHRAQGDAIDMIHTEGGRH